MSDLLPCPFCGGEAELAHVAGSTPRHRVRCKACTMASPMRTKASQAIAAWNRRTPASTVLPDRAPARDTHPSPHAREAALRIVGRRYMEDAQPGPVSDEMLVARALLSPGGPQDIASIVEKYTDILSPETARKVAGRIRSISR